MTPAAPILTRPEPHPILPVFTPAEIDQMLETREGAERYTRWLNAHQERIRLAAEDPLYHGLPLDCWSIADEQLADPELDLQINFGWNRGGGKTHRALQRLCEAALEYPANGDAGYLVLGETEDSLKFVQMPKVWMFLKPYIKQFNGMQKGPYRVTHKPGTGFTEGLVIIPSGPIRNESGDITGFRSTSNIWFDTYKGDPGKYEGREFGGRLPIIGRTESGKGIPLLSRRPDATPRPEETPELADMLRRWDAKSLIQNVGVVADEGLALNWLRMIKRRAPFRLAKTIWAYTPVRGITPCIKEAVGSLQIETSAPADRHVRFENFVPDVPGCPKGHMPVTGVCQMPRTKAVYFHIDPQSFNDYFNIVKADCAGKDQRYIERIAFGYSSDTIDRQFNYGDWNLIDEEQLPAVGTDFFIVDWHDRKPPFCIWGRVGVGEFPDHYIWWDWPAAQTFGEWALATERELTADTRRGWDGDPGPAQGNIGDLGYLGLKRIWQGIETVHPDGPVERDPKRRALQIRAQAEGRPLRMEIFYRIIDSRAGPRAQLAEEGKTCTMWEFAKEHHDAATGETLAPVVFEPAKGNQIDLTLIKTLLEYRRNEEGIIVQHPRLHVVRRCLQVDWALRNYTGWSGEAGASKDPIDTVHYMAQHELFHVSPRTFGSTGGGSY